MLFFTRLFISFYFIFFIGDYARQIVFNASFSILYPTASNLVSQIIISLFFTSICSIPYMKTKHYPQKNAQMIMLVLVVAFFQLGFLSITLIHLAKIVSQNEGHFLLVSGLLILLNTINMLFALLEHQKSKV